MNDNMLKLKSESSRWVLGKPWRNAFYMTLPALILLAIFYFYPILRLIPKSFIDSDGHVTASFFTRVFSDKLYIETLLRTLKNRCHGDHNKFVAGLSCCLCSCAGQAEDCQSDGRDYNCCHSGPVCSCGRIHGWSYCSVPESLIRRCSLFISSMSR